MCWHKWTKWEQYDEEGMQQRHPFAKEMLPYREKRQKRHCIKCGKEQDEIIR